MLNCKDMTKLISDSLEHQVPFRRRMEMRLHIMMCTLCRNFRENAMLLRKVARSSPDIASSDTESPSRVGENQPEASIKLSPAAKRRIIAALEDSPRK